MSDMFSDNKGYRDSGKPTEQPKEKLWHVIYLGQRISGSTGKVEMSNVLISFFEQEEMNLWLESNRNVIQKSAGNAIMVYGHISKIRVQTQTIHTIHTDPVK